MDNSSFKNENKNRIYTSTYKLSNRDTKRSATKDKPMSDIIGSLRRMGYTKEEFVSP